MDRGKVIAEMLLRPQIPRRSGFGHDFGNDRPTTSFHWPGPQREFRTINALASHTIAITHSIAFSQAYQLAISKADIEAVLTKYDYLFHDKRSEAQTALTFSSGGLLQITADGVPLKF